MKMVSTLIIDDDPIAAKLLISILKQNFTDIDIVGKADGVQRGLEMIRTLDPDLVFLDVEMPDGTGFELLDSLSDRRFELAMVSSCDTYNQEAYNHSAQKFLQKPVCVDDLKHFVCDFMTKYKKSLGLQFDPVN
ncbi:LytR/AlgR family response regulator transcription factor [Mangrovibacterium lignilyticum]|uniref:LytR/AlgR family response regulator transcription factor n=1 Tax=Mangrovibacterium lignilyticum TaxID=2668052 RepID=UPI0013D542F2|nr:response regulator [Mangrovibacterium lignilyticum]